MRVPLPPVALCFARGMHRIHAAGLRRLRCATSQAVEPRRVIRGAAPLPQNKAAAYDSRRATTSSATPTPAAIRSSVMLATAR